MRALVVAVVLVMAVVGALVYLDQWHPSNEPDTRTVCVTDHYETYMQCDSIKTGGGIDMGGGIECRTATRNVCDAYGTQRCYQWVAKRTLLGRKPYLACEVYQ